MRPRHGSRDQRLGTSRANLRERARFRRLAGTHAVPAVDRRQAEDWRYLKRRTHNAPPTNHRRERCRALGCSKGSTRRIMIGGLLARKPRMLVVVARANKKARISGPCWRRAKGGIFELRSWRRNARSQAVEGLGRS